MGKELEKVLSRGLVVPEEDIRSFCFDHLDLALAAYLIDPPEDPATGLVIPAPRALEVDEKTIRVRLMDAQRCAWISAEIRKAVAQRLGNVVAAVYQKAIRTGDPARARFLFELYEKARPKEVNVRHLHLDLSQLTNEELSQFIADRRRVIEGTTVEVLPTTPHPPEDAE